MSFICDYPDCQKELSSKYNLKRHIECYHKKIRKFECEFCFKKFSSAQNLKEHLYLHETPGEYSDVPKQASVEIQIPLLSDLVYGSEDPDIRPMMKVIRVYPYPPI